MVLIHEEDGGQGRSVVGQWWVGTLDRPECTVKGEPVACVELGQCGIFVMQDGKGCQEAAAWAAAGALGPRRIRRPLD